MSSTNLKNKKSDVLSKKGLEESVLSRAFKANSDWPDKEEFLDVIYWLRQILGVILGVVWGVIPLKGFIGLLLFCACNAAIIYAYYSVFQSVDDEEYGGPWEMTKEGFMTSFAGFLVTWITVYAAFVER